MFYIKKGADYYLNKKKGKKLLDIKFIGIGGAFDIEEGESSVIIETQMGKKFLIDCGYTSYAYLKKNKIIQDIDRVFITHTHSDHISGLSTLIYDRFYVHGLQTIIECTPEVATMVETYLKICGHPEGQFTINSTTLFFDDEEISVAKIDTTAYHWPVPGFANSGLIFHFRTGDDFFALIYSGDINVPVTSLLSADAYPFIYDKPENIFIFHDMTSLVHEQNPHTHFDLLTPVKKQFNNLFTYHHGEDTIERINQSNPEMAMTSLIIQGNSFIIEENRGL